MTARLTADSKDAVMALQQAADDLKKQLEDAGITLQGLDIGARSDDGTQARSFAGQLADGERDRPRGGFSRLLGGDAEPEAPAQPIRTRVPLEGGALLDVLA
jgi:hypothetical protein